MNLKYIRHFNVSTWSIPVLSIVILFISSFASAQWRQAASPNLASGTSATIDIVRTGKVLVGRTPLVAGSPFTTEARIEAFNGSLAQVQVGSFGNFAPGNTWGAIGQAGTINFPINAAYGLAMVKNDRLGFYNLVDGARSNGISTKDMVAGFGTSAASIDFNQRFSIRYFVGLPSPGGVAPTVTNTIFSANPNGSVGINTEEPASTLFVDATAAVSSSPFKSMFILNNGSLSSFTNSTFSALGQEGNSTINAPIHGMRTQVGPKIALNVSVNATDTVRQEAEITWQDLDFLSPATNASTNQDRLSFYFRSGTNNPLDRKQAMTILPLPVVGIDVKNPTVVAVNNSSILFFGNKKRMRFDVPTGPMRSQGFYRLETDNLKSQVQDIPSALPRILGLLGRTYLWAGYNNDQKSPTYGLDEQSVFTELPDAHFQHEDGQVSIDYDAVLAAVVEAIKEMNGVFTRQAEIANEAITEQSVVIKTQKELIQSQQDAIEILVEKVNSMAVIMGENQISLNSTSKGVLDLPIKNSVLSLSNDPNPSNGNTAINYDLNTNEPANLIITDQKGKLVKSFTNIANGKNSIVLNQVELNAGIYNYSIVVNGRVEGSKKMVIIK
mgnify:CR=1 FL=1